MNNVEFFVFGICFAATAGCAFAFMWQSMNMLREEPRPRKKNIHPEMENVQSGEELLVFSAKEDDDNDDGDDVIIIRN